MFDSINIEGKDFPYYNDSPPISKLQWFLLLLSLPISLIGYSLISKTSEILASIILCLILLLPLLHFSNWNYKLIFDKITKDEVKLAVFCFVGYLIYASITLGLLSSVGLNSVSDSVPYVVTWETILSLLFSMMGEELIKFIPLMFFMRVFYKFSGKKILALTFSAIIVLTGFGLLHYSADRTIASVLLIQGLGSIFELYGYIKTKNLFVPYLSHLFTDAIIMLMMMFAS